MIKIISFLVIFLGLIYYNLNHFYEKFEDGNVFNDYFDKIIYINLEHRKDRKEQI